MSKAPEPIHIIEAALFASGKTVSKEELAAMAGVTPDEAAKLVKELRSAYEGRAVEIADLEGRYIMQVRPALASRVRTLAPMEMDPSILRTLGVIAYNQPVAQADVVRVRGAKTYDHVRFLEERKLVKSKPYGHTKILETTEEFDAYFMSEKLERPEGATLTLPAPGSPESAAVEVAVEAPPAKGS
jgi:segregation and condensation protein B